MNGREVIDNIIASHVSRLEQEIVQLREENARLRTMLDAGPSANGNEVSGKLIHEIPAGATDA